MARDLRPHRTVPAALIVLLVTLLTCVSSASAAIPIVSLQLDGQPQSGSLPLRATVLGAVSWNLLSNSAFADQPLASAPAGWTVTANNATVQAFVVAPDWAPGPSRAMRLRAAVQPGGYASANPAAIAVTAGTSYDLSTSVNVVALGSSSGAGMNVVWLDSDGRMVGLDMARPVTTLGPGFVSLTAIAPPGAVYAYPSPAVYSSGGSPSIVDATFASPRFAPQTPAPSAANPNVFVQYRKRDGSWQRANGDCIAMRAGVDGIYRCTLVTTALPPGPLAVRALATDDTGTTRTSPVLAATVRRAIVGFASAAYTVNESHGSVNVLVCRDDAVHAEWLWYALRGHGATVAGVDFVQPPAAQLHLTAGQRCGSFLVSILGRGTRKPSLQIDAYLFGSYPDDIGVSRTTITVLRTTGATLKRNSRVAGQLRTDRWRSRARRHVPDRRWAARS